MNKDIKILTAGEIIWDVYPDKKCIGGAPLNFAAHASLQGANAAMVSAVGNDELGASAKEYVENFGVSCKYIKLNEKTTGICDVTLDSRGVPSYSVRRDTSYDNITLDDRDIKEINEERFGLFYFGTLIQRSELSQRAIEKILTECEFAEILCDINLRPDCYSKSSVLTCLKHATILKMSDEEEPLLRALGIYDTAPEGNEEIAKALARKFPNLKIIIITMGAKGSFAYRAKDAHTVTEAPIPVKLASTVGAGDSFSAAFAVAHLSGKSLEEAMRAGTELSSFVVSRTEAVPRR